MNYEFLLSSRTAAHWKRFGAHRRAGILFPLFSLHSAESAGVGEFADLARLARWCRSCGLSIVQLLPLNDVGTDFRPYDASSSLALDPMHLSLADLAGVPGGFLAADLARLRGRFPLKGRRFFDTGIKPAKLELLRRAFDAREKNSPDFDAYKKSESAWLEPYAQFKVLKARFGGAMWEAWDEPLKNRRPEAIEKLKAEAAGDLEFQQWLQWQCARQLEAARREANREGVLVFGDLPFLVSRDSADVWAEPAAFKLDKASGAPPDLYFADGQAWGMPPHDWAAQEKTGFAYLRRKIGYAARFYDGFRIDHFVGLFRLWTYERGADGRARKETGAFDPPDEKLWEAQGRKILDAMLTAAPILPCAEDLGVVPGCSGPVLREYGIPGMEIQRWTRHWETTGEWKEAAEYRVNAIAMISTHDMPPLELWWKTEAVSAEERGRFLRFVGLPPEKDHEPKTFVRASLQASLSTPSIFDIQLFQDWFSLENPGTLEEGERINFPGLIRETNWRLLCRYSIEEMSDLKSNTTIRQLVLENKRLP